MEYILRYKENALTIADVVIETHSNRYETVCFNARVLSWGFAGSIRFSVSRTAFFEFIASLNEFHEGRCDEVILRGTYEDQFIRFRVDQLGYTEVKGMFARHYPRNAVEFEFLVDHKGLGRFTQSLTSGSRSTDGGSMPR